MVVGRQAEVAADIFRSESYVTFLAQSNFLGGDAGDLGNLLVEAADAALAGVVADDELYVLLCELEVFRSEAMLAQLLGQQMLAGYLNLFFGQISGHVYHLHTVLQGRVDGGDVVGGGYEKHLRQVIVDVEVIVVESGILLRVESLQQGRGRVSVEILSHLVDLVEHYHGVRCAAALDGLYDAARHGADVGAAVSADLALVMQSAQRNAAVLAAEGRRYRFSERGLADARRAPEAEDRRFHVAFQLEHGEVLDYPFLNALKAEMVIVKHLLGVGQIEVVFSNFVPRQLQKGRDISVFYIVVGRRRVQPLQLLQLLLESFGHLLRPFLAFGGFPQLRDVLVVRVHSQLFLDGLKLVVKVVFALLLVDFALHLVLDVLADLEQLDLLVQQLKELDGPLLELVLPQQLDLLQLVLDIDGGGHEVDQESLVLDALDGEAGLLGDVLVELDYVHRGILDALCKRFYLSVAFVDGYVGQIGDPGHHVRLVDVYRYQIETANALDYGSHRPVRNLYYLHDAAQRAYLEKVLLVRILDFRVLLGDCAYKFVRLVGFVQQFYRFLSPDRNGDHSVREEHNVSQWQYWQDMGQLLFLQVVDGFDADQGCYFHSLSVSKK